MALCKGNDIWKGPRQAMDPEPSRFFLELSVGEDREKIRITQVRLPATKKTESVHLSVLCLDLGEQEK